ncbi:hypothetical protein [Methanolobus sp.]|uniref:hypothetical protein n=1 Tax=Methanolobus sp. TaxID=1874737 RepID=UPI0025E4F8CF|nr:hypothetical protein [Methanolobus sp.]
MPKHEDFSWDKGKIKNGSSLGKIISIPAQGDDIEGPDDVELRIDTKEDIVVDEFKERMAEILSRELHKKQ